MRPHVFLLPVLLLPLLGCQESKQPTPDTVQEVPEPLPNPLGQATDKDEDKKKPDRSGEHATHTIVSEVEYYTDGPQQGRPPDGTFKPGTKVTLLREAGSYSLVRSADGIEAYVAADVLQKVDQPKPDVIAVAKSNNRFAFDLYGRLRSESGNLFFSPNSISTALAMTYAGAEGETASQMAEVLHFDLAEDRLHPAFSALIDRLHGKQKGIELRVANRLWGRTGYEFVPAFLRVTREQYGAELGEVDFVQQTETARQQINSWVEDQTNGKITDLIPQGVLNSLTRLVLTNAIYFKGNWTSQFEKKATKDAPFHLSAEETVEVPLMHQKEEFKYGETDDIQILELPYVGNDLSMLILLPKKTDGLSSLEEKLSAENLDKLTSTLHKEEVKIYLPKFRVTSQFSLSKILESMGMAAAFNPGQADFSGISSDERLHISAVVHKAFVDVNEEGTEAAAATGIGVGAVSVEIPRTFRADHPFVFLIREKTTGSVLFLGRVVNPKE